MQAKDFTLLKALLQQVHYKAFSEPLSAIPYGKAQTLSWFIEEATGHLLSYKTLTNYIQAVLADEPDLINPNTATLAILVRFVHGQVSGKDSMVWFRYRQLHLQQLVPIRGGSLALGAAS